MANDLIDEDQILRDAGEALIKQANALAEAESHSTTAGNVLRQAWRDIFGIVFSGDLDFVTKLLIVAAWLSLLLMFVYLVVPMSMRRKLEKLDFDEKIGGYLSISGSFAIMSAVMLAIFKVQKG